MVSRETGEKEREPITVAPLLKTRSQRGSSAAAAIKLQAEIGRKRRPAREQPPPNTSHTSSPLKLTGCLL